jgi:PD-(D/E)XK nuclease superfamily
MGELCPNFDLFNNASEVRFKIGTLREARNRFADQLAPEFRIFDYLRTDEMGLSRCIASLFDPKGKHGQGSFFLDAFLKILSDKSGWEANAKDFLKVELEKQANGQRRIDIYLEFKNGIIGIENKPWASDQDTQLTDYATYLEKTAGNKDWLLVF